MNVWYESYYRLIEGVWVVEELNSAANVPAFAIVLRHLIL